MDQPTSSRRAFLKTSAMAGLGALSAGMLGGCSSHQSDQEPSSFTDRIEWDGAFDVVVIGFGAAGASAAISAAESGATVLVVDKAPEGSEGGNSRYSTQLFVSAEDRQQALVYHQALRGGYYVPDDVLGVYADGLAVIRDTLVGWGLDRSELLDVTDVTEEDINEIAKDRQSD